MVSKTEGEPKKRKKKKKGEELVYPPSKGERRRVYSRDSRGSRRGNRDN